MSWRTDYICEGKGVYLFRNIKKQNTQHGKYLNRNIRLENLFLGCSLLYSPFLLRVLLHGPHKEAQASV